MRGVNKVIIVGNVGNDPEISYTPAGVAVANFSVATSESWADKNSGQKQERTEWHRCTAFKRTAEVIGEFLKKGSQVYVEGQIKTDKYQDKKSGEDRYSTGIIVREVQFLGSRNDSGQSAKAVDSGSAGGGEFSDVPF